MPRTQPPVEERDLTYAGLLADTERLASGLKARGVSQGDVVGIYPPMIPEVVVAMPPRTETDRKLAEGAMS